MRLHLHLYQTEMSAFQMITLTFILKSLQQLPDAKLNKHHVYFSVSTTYDEYQLLLFLFFVCMYICQVVSHPSPPSSFLHKDYRIDYASQPGACKVLDVKIKV